MKDFADVIKFTKDLTLLYVEDDEEVREATVMVLSSLFANIVVAEDGEDGLEKFYETNIDFVISDVNMPNMNGLEMAERIKEYDRSVPIVMFSAHNESKYFTKAIDVNVDAYILKPLQLDDFLTTLKCILEQKEYDKEYKNNIAFLEQYKDLTDSLVAVSKTDSEGIITYVNDQFCKISGYSREEVIGKNHNIIRNKETDPSVYTDIWHTIKNNKQPWKGILKNTSKDGKTYYVDIVIRPILDIDENILEYISIKNDVTHTMSPTRQIHDFVESAYNPMIVIMKVDGFADIESFYGYKLAQMLEESIGKDLVKLMPYDLGFKKFIVLDNSQYAFIQDLDDPSHGMIEYIESELKNMQEDVSELRIDVEDLQYDVSVSMSVSLGKECYENAVYGMKYLEETKQTYIFADNLASQEYEKAENNLKVLKMVQQALNTSNIISYFQPIVCNKTQEIIKYESLVRLIDQDENVVAPYYFLDIAKKGKYYAQITGVVLENSFEALYKTDKKISINISALDIEKGTTREKIFELIEKHKDIANRVVFELLEDEGIQNFEHISSFISTVKGYGVKIAIDDFGAGYSNYERLLKYQPDILKIDGSLIKNIETDYYSLSVVKSIVAFAKEQKIEMIAEYIENENIFNILKDLGVEYSQGYFFGKPTPME